MISSIADPASLTELLAWRGRAQRVANAQVSERRVRNSSLA